MRPVPWLSILLVSLSLISLITDSHGARLVKRSDTQANYIALLRNAPDTRVMIPYFTTDPDYEIYASAIIQEKNMSVFLKEYDSSIERSGRKKVVVDKRTFIHDLLEVHAYALSTANPRLLLKLVHIVSRELIRREKGLILVMCTSVMAPSLTVKTIVEITKLQLMMFYYPFLTSQAQTKMNQLGIRYKISAKDITPKYRAFYDEIQTWSADFRLSDVFAIPIDGRVAGGESHDPLHVFKVKICIAATSAMGDIKSSVSVRDHLSTILETHLDGLAETYVKIIECFTDEMVVEDLFEYVKEHYEQFGQDATYMSIVSFVDFAMQKRYKSHRVIYLRALLGPEHSDGHSMSKFLPLLNERTFSGSCLELNATIMEFLSNLTKIHEGQDFTIPTLSMSETFPPVTIREIDVSGIALPKFADFYSSRNISQSPLPSPSHRLHRSIIILRPSSMEFHIAFSLVYLACFLYWLLEYWKSQ